MREFYQAADRVEAQMLKDHLSQAGIATVIIGDHLSGAVGELPANIYPTLWVLNDRDLEQAERLTAAFFNRSPVIGKAWRCTVCGEDIDGGFEICWNCGSPNPNDKTNKE
jgi:hypothetical protein